MATALVAIGLIGIFFVSMSVRMIFIKGGRFRGTCASQSPFLGNESGTCGYCGKKGEGKCQKEEPVSEKAMSSF